MINDSTRESIYREVETKFPWPRSDRESGAEAESCGVASGWAEFSNGADLNVLWQSELQTLLGQVKDQVLFQLHAMFEIPASAGDIQSAVDHALAAQYALEHSCASRGSYDATGYARFLFRQYWQRTAEDSRSRALAAPSLLTGLRHVETSGYFQKTPMEIGSWTKWFLQLERYHRHDAVHSEQRLDRYRALHRGLGSAAPRSFDDLLIWLEFRLLAEPEGVEADVASLSRQVVQEPGFEGWNHLFPGIPASAAIYIVLRCHQMCLVEIVEPREQRRFQQMLATRQLDTILDLMRLIMHRTMGERRLPEAAVLLRQLQAEGFKIDHQRFHDPYQANLVPIAATELFELSRLPLLVSLEEMTGEFQTDLESNEARLGTWYQRLLQEAARELEIYRQARRQALPRAQLLRQLVRFCAAWVLAKYPWPLDHLPTDLFEEVRGLLPDSAVRYLVRPRKGYELKSKQDLQALITNECRQQKEALQRIATSACIQGLHDYSCFIRYLLHQHWREKLGLNLDDESMQERTLELLPAELRGLGWVISTARRWGIDLHQANPHSLESVRDYLREITPEERLMERLAADFVASENERRRVYQGLLLELLPTFHRLVVAHGRIQAQLPRLCLSELWRDEVPALIALLTPTQQFLREMASGRVQQHLMHSSAAMYRGSMRPHLHNVAEWHAYLAWETHRRLGVMDNLCSEDGDAERLLRDLEEAASRVVLPHHELFTETVQGAVLALLQPSPTLPDLPPETLGAVLAMLPRVDCGACGQANCRAFAGALLFDRTSASACVQLPATGVEALQEVVVNHRPMASVVAAADGLLEVLKDRRKWRQSTARVQFHNVLSVPVQKARQMLTERLQGIWRRLTPKPQIFKWPSSEEFYQGLCRYLGYEAAERLQRAERHLLVEHGDVRRQSEWRVFVERRDWLGVARRRRQSQPLLRHQDPTWVARQAYDQVFFLHQLSSRDRDLVLRQRLEQHQDGFSRWWNDDLLTMNLPGFSIRDWEDFSKIIKNAYWHQEMSLPGGDVLAVLQQGSGQDGLPPEADPVHMLHAYLERLMGQEQAAHERRREILQQHRRGQSVVDTGQLRELIEAFVDGSGREREPCRPSTEGAGAGVGSGWVVDAEDQCALDLESLWDQFQQMSFAISPAFVCRWEDLTSDEAEVLLADLARTGTALVRPRESAVVICSWDQPLPKRIGLVRSLLFAAILRRRCEELECGWLQAKLRDRSLGRPPLGSIRLLIRQRLRSGMEREQIHQELLAALAGAGAYPGLIDGWCADLLHHLACKRQYQLADGSSGLALGLPGETDEESVLYRFPMLTAFLDRLLERHLILDRERLLRSLFLLAKMEGNLDTLTGLLREIRETSDVIEAAWLRFTEERIVEGPVSKALPGTSLGVQLLVSHLKDKDVVNRGLREGIGRREKRNVTAAYHELINFIRYHVLIRADGQGQIEEVITDIQHAGYDLNGIDDAALAAAVEKEWQRREQLQDQKIWIYTNATARRLAAQHGELQEAERIFYKARMDLLRDVSGSVAEGVETATMGSGTAEGKSSGLSLAEETPADVVRRRGVALGQIKEELYRQLSDLLESERLATFQKRIGQIVTDLDRKRWEIHEGWYRGRIDRRTVFYLLRQFQKNQTEPSWDDFHRFLVDHWFDPVETLAASSRPDRDQRLLDLDERFRALLGVSLLQLQQEAEAAAGLDFRQWLDQQNRWVQGKLVAEVTT
jgi:hypothetical protein